MLDLNILFVLCGTYSHFPVDKDVNIQIPISSQSSRMDVSFAGFIQQYKHTSWKMHPHNRQW